MYARVVYTHTSNTACATFSWPEPISTTWPAPTTTSTFLSESTYVYIQYITTRVISGKNYSRERSCTQLNINICTSPMETRKHTIDARWAIAIRATRMKVHHHHISHRYSHDSHHVTHHITHHTLRHLFVKDNANRYSHQTITVTEQKW